MTCHDLDTFRCLLDPAAEPRPRWFRALARRTLEGLRTAAAVACVSEATRAAILRHGLLPEENDAVVDAFLKTHADFRERDVCELRMFGVTAQLVGTGAGRWLMNRAIDAAWSNTRRRARSRVICSCAAAFTRWRTPERSSGSRARIS